MRTQAPGFWNDPKAAEKIVKQVRELKAWIEGCENVSRSIDDLNVLFEFAKEGEATEEEVDAHYAETLQLVEALELKNMLQGEADQQHCYSYLHPVYFLLKKRELPQQIHGKTQS